ncbi:PAS-domain containing protein [Sulfitobacter geojensis]|uniref:PAS-domain containing protein n=1 Tax=Sulfitobacter geojensis TaxID=1342299 RepID=UPI000468E703|nr:PAS-domain containing protein [Sulfitobacter geojensis]KHA50414.1 PAS/PAC domain protein [Sulfitobacter geojensis]NYI27198.1 PAS domain-containing protein [Sulfitobacter geojensis]
MLANSEIIFVTLIATLTAFIARYFLKDTRTPVASLAAENSDPLSFLFDDGVLHHASTSAMQRFSLAPGTHVWDDLRGGLLGRFPDFPERPGVGATGSMKLRPAQSNDRVELEMNWRDGMCWVQLNDVVENSRQSGLSARETGPMERCVRTMVQPAWEVNANGRVGWHNDAYDLLERRLGTLQDGTLFSLDGTKNTQRCSAINAKGHKEWFEVVTHQTETGSMNHATPITALVNAEEAQRTFVQTLAKTFAHLPVGLAIFDRRGQLGIFNPALVDLSGLQASFLATQPTMMAFFDALRENRRMPEPKNYRSWRQDIADVITAASDGQYHETWTLEDGRTYSVQGRPHPDGATAFLIEDISAEITLSRSYRAEVEQFETLLDTVDDALVVFSSTGVLTFCNAAYRKMWGQNPEAAFADVTVHDAAKLWQDKAHKDTDWSKLIRFTTVIGPRPVDNFDLTLTQGTKLRCTLCPLAADATLVRFSQNASTVVPIESSAPADH